MPAFVVVEVDNDGFKVYDSGGTLIDPAKDASVLAITTALNLIKDTDGIKKITDPLPAGTNNIGDVDVASSALPTGASTEATLALVATETKLEAVRALLATIDADTSNLDVALSTVATEITLEAVRVLLASIDGKDFATETTLAAADTKLGTIDGVLDSIKDTDGIKKIVDALPAGTNEIGRVRLRDDHGKDAQLSAFGLLKTANESVLGDYRLDASSIVADFTAVKTGTGDYSIEPGGTGVKLTTGASASSKVTLESKKTHYYQSGRGQLAKFSVILGDTGVAGNVREWGYGDSNNGVFFRMDGTTLKLVIRRNGSEVHSVDSTAWDTPVTPDQYGHLYYIQFEWLGVGNFFIYYDEEIVHTYNFLGTSTELSIGSPDLPLWFRNENSTNDTDVYMKMGCASVVMEGGTLISGLDLNGIIRQCTVDEDGNLKVVFTASSQALPLLVNPNYEQSDGAIAANQYKRVITYAIPDDYDGWLIRFSSYQNEQAKSRLVSYKDMGTYDFVTGVYTSDEVYVLPQWSALVEAEVTTETSSAGTTVTLTVTYTNESGVSGRTGTISIPKSSPVGSRWHLILQSGDLGVTSIQGITDDSPNVGAVKICGNIQLAYHNDLSATIQLETNYQPGAIAFPTGTKLAVEYEGGTVNKDRLFDILIQLVEATA